MVKKLPDISLVLPCYNEEKSIGQTIPELCRVFQDNGTDVELITVDNGSTDGTSEIIDQLIIKGFPIKKVCLKENQGYGGGILEGLNACTAPIMGSLCADGQVSAEDALMAYRLIMGREDRVVSKVRRRFRKDSWKRKIVSIIYNGLMQVLYGRLGAIDINGSPKVFSREVFNRLKLVSRDWFLDPEIIIKAKYLGLRVIEVDVEGYARRGGKSNVRMETCAEFLKNIVKYRLCNELRSWKMETLKDIAKKDAVPTENTGIGSNCIIEEKGGNGLESVRIIEQNRFEDSRGFLQKVLTATHCKGNLPRGEVYVVGARPGESRGNHYHLNMGEWFTAIQGSGEIRLCDLESEHVKVIPLGATLPLTVYVPAGVAHAIVNKDDQMLICVAWAENEHDPEDVYSYSFSAT